MRNLVFVDCEARGQSPVRGTLTEFGAVHYGTRQTFHGRLFEGTPDPENPAIPLVGAPLRPAAEVAAEFADWIAQVCDRGRPVFVSDNPAYDWQWISALFDVAGIDNPFGHSGRRISDFYAGLMGDFGQTQGWKKYRITEHDHNPVNDSLGNAEAFATILELARQGRL